MTRSQRLKRIVVLNEMQKTVAAQRLATTRGRCDDNLRKLEDFRRYREEYARVLYHPGHLLNAVTARETLKFLSQLERTINALEALVTRSQRECADDLAAWKREAQRASVLVEVLDRCLRNEHQLRESRLQREIDDRPRSMLEIG